MKLIQGNRFKINNTEYQVRYVTWKEGKRESYTFATTNWDKPVMEYTMAAKEFESKVSFEQYMSLT